MLNQCPHIGFNLVGFLLRIRLGMPPRTLIAIWLGMLSAANLSSCSIEWQALSAYPVFHLSSEKTHEGEPAAYLVFNPFVGKMVQVLENQHFDQERHINGLSSVVALPFLLMHPCRSSRKTSQLIQALSFTSGSPIAVNLAVRAQYQQRPDMWVRAWKDWVDG